MYVLQDDLCWVSDADVCQLLSHQVYLWQLYVPPAYYVLRNVLTALRSSPGTSTFHSDIRYASADCWTTQDDRLDGRDVRSPKLALRDTRPKSEWSEPGLPFYWYEPAGCRRCKCSFDNFVKGTAADEG